MNNHLYKLTCLTNMHVGAGASNYSIVDNEVEKDELLDCPIIHSSGVKGALRDFAKTRIAPEEINYIFGSPVAAGNAGGRNSGQQGAYNFLGANMLTRPIRVSTGPTSFINVTTADIVNNFITVTSNFGCIPAKLAGLELLRLEDSDFGTAEFLCSENGFCVEGETTARLDIEENQLELLKKLLGDRFAIAKKLGDYPLPVIARNSLGDNQNLWYEEFVPHHSVFYMLVLPPANTGTDRGFAIEKLLDDSIVQFGGNASVGYGFTRIDKWE